MSLGVKGLNSESGARFGVITALLLLLLLLLLRTRVFWDITPRRILSVYQRFEVLFYFHPQGDITFAAPVVVTCSATVKYVKLNGFTFKCIIILLQLFHHFQHTHYSVVSDFNSPPNISTHLCNLEDTDLTYLLNLLAPELFFF